MDGMIDWNTSNGILEHLIDRADLLYRFAMLYSDSEAENRDYGVGEPINTVEVHTLASIEDNPGINVSELALFWNRTKGAISQTVTKLEKKGCIARRRQEGNAKTVLLYPTEKGLRLARAHRLRASRETQSTIDALLSSGCTMEEIDAFFHVLAQYVAMRA